MKAEIYTAVPDDTCGCGPHQLRERSVGCGDERGDGDASATTRADLAYVRLTAQQGEIDVRWQGDRRVAVWFVRLYEVDEAGSLLYELVVAAGDDEYASFIEGPAGRRSVPTDPVAGEGTITATFPLEELSDLPDNFTWDAGVRGSDGPSPEVFDLCPESGQRAAARSIVPWGNTGETFASRCALTSRRQSGG